MVYKKRVGLIFLKNLSRFKKVVSVSLVLMMIFAFGRFDASAKGREDEKKNTSMETKGFYKGPKLDASKRIKLNSTKIESKLDNKLLELTGRKKSQQ